MRTFNYTLTSSSSNQPVAAGHQSQPMHRRAGRLHGSVKLRNARRWHLVQQAHMALAGAVTYWSSAACLVQVPFAVLGYTIGCARGDDDDNDHPISENIAFIA